MGRSTPARTMTTTTTTTHGPAMRYRRAQTRRSTRARLLRHLRQGRPMRRRSRRRRRSLRRRHRRRRPSQQGRHVPLAACATVAMPRCLLTSAATASRCLNTMPDWASSQRTADIRIMIRSAQSSALCGGGLVTRRPAAQPAFFWHGLVARRTTPTTVLPRCSLRNSIHVAALNHAARADARSWAILQPELRASFEAEEHPALAGSGVAHEPEGLC